MKNSKNEQYFEAFWPRSPRQTQVKPLARRLDTLNGKTVAQLWDFIFRGDEVFALLEEGLKARFPDIRFVSWREIGNTHGAEERQTVASLPRRLKELEVDAVISGMGC
ncbi:MAG: hypothetical protein HY323_15655 [Betaproteobacteria bacterium]|nr:hypothetical protein [Betaproteobacteria bacterium]